MKKIVRFIVAAQLLFLVISVSSCKKVVPSNVTGSVYYMKYKVDGVQKEYSISGGKTIDTLISGVAYGATVAGSPNDGSESMGLLLYSTTVISNPQTFDDDNIPGYVLPEGSLDYVTNSGGLSYSSMELTSPNVEIKITEITSAYIKGTFKGKLKEIDGSNVVNVTDGEFYAVRQP
ncbi:MAG: hypothetical protein JST81_05005 [Bacteroidetes bacterium]|jgi:hypothetical protein|nr:hypothetical protein [Bacteroidota bacterium]